MIMPNMNKNFKNGITSYKVTDSLNSNNGYYEVGLDEQNNRVIINTNLERFVFNKTADFNGGLMVDGFRVLTSDNIGNITGISVDKLDGLDLDDTALATTDENNAIYSGKKVRELLKTEVIPSNIEYTHAGYPGIGTVSDALNELLYIPIKINSFTSNKSVNEKGSTATNIVLTWDINGALVREQKFNGVGIPISDRSKTIATLNTTTTYTLEVKDDRNAKATKTTTVSFLNGRYFGTSSSTTIDNSLILSLTKELVESKSKTFTVNAGPNDYIYFCIPKRLGTCRFTVGGFEGGFTLQSEVNFTNASGFTEVYYVYKSSNKGLGNTTVVVS